MTTNYMIKLEQVTKKYASHYCLRDISLEIKLGEFIVIKGQNGTGKSTLLKLISGLIPVTSGQRKVGYRHMNVGYTPDHLTPLKMTSTEYLAYMGKISSIPQQQLEDRIIELHQLLQLEQNHQLYMTQYSKGMLQKLNLMQAMLTKPKLLILDEPFSGLDEITTQQLCSSLNEINNSGTTIILTTHETPNLHMDYTIYWIKDGQLIKQEMNAKKSTSNTRYKLLCNIAEDHVHQQILKLYPDSIFTREKNNLVSFVLNNVDYRMFLIELINREVEIIKFERME